MFGIDQWAEAGRILRRLDCFRLLVETEMLKSLLMRAWKSHHRGYQNAYKQTVNRNLDLKNTSHEDAERTKKTCCWKLEESGYLLHNGKVSRTLSFSGGSVCKEFACNAEDLASIPGLGRSPGEGKGYPLQYSGLENSRDGSPGMLQFMGLQRVRCH